MSKPLRVVLVEDSEADARLLDHELQRGGYAPAVRRAATAAGLAGALEAGEWDLILVGDTQADPDAAAALRLAREQDPGIPLVVVSGRADEEAAVTALKAGAADYVRKENLARLVPAVERALAEAQEGRRRREAEAARENERLATEAALREGERRYRLLFEASPLPMWVYDTHSLEFLAVNEAAIQHYGYAREEFLARTIHDIRPPEDVPALLADIASRGRERSTRVWRHMKRDGSLIYVEVTAHDIRFTGRPARLAVLNDVTKRLASEAARERLVAILEATSDLVAITTREGPVVYMNPAGVRLLGVEDAAGLRLSDYTPPETMRRLLEEAIPAAEREGVWNGETALCRRDGRPFPVSQVIIAHRGSDGQMEYLSTIARDITTHRLLEQQLLQSQKMEAVGRLAGGIAHDFNNMLAVIVGYSGLLLNRADLAPAVRTCLEPLHSAAERAAGLTRQLLAFSRKQIAAPERVDLNQVIRGMEGMLRRLLGEDLDLVADPQASPCPVVVDVGQIEQMLLNLAVNARDAMPNGGRLTIETRTLNLDESYVREHAGVQPGPYVMLAVSDTGCGMDEETLSHIFEPFFTTKGEGHGTGLGLSTVYGIAQQSGGHIWVYSEPGQGTAFKIYLPCAGGDAPAGRPSTSPAALHGGSETALVVEDEGMVRSLVTRTLQAFGYQVLEAPSPDAALRLCQEHAAPIHLLVSDVVLPGMNGRVLAEQLREQRPEMKVLFMSGYTDDAIVRHGVLTAEFAFIQKPFSPGALARKVSELLHAGSLGEAE
jgi:PAS domain S-box-containing protein